MMKFMVGDKVRVIKQPDSAEENIIGEVGIIVDIDPDWIFPYEVDFGEGRDFGVELFDENDLELVASKRFVEMYEEVEKHQNNKSYINIKFQEGAIGEVGVNGCQIEDVINVLVERLEGFQKGGLPCRENALAITKLEEARMWLNERTRKRKEQGVEGKNEQHK